MGQSKRNAVPSADDGDLLYALRDIERRAAAAVEQVEAVAAGEHKTLAPLIEREMALGEVPTAAVLTHIRRNAEARDRFIESGGGLLSSSEIADLARSGAANRAQLAHRWRKAGWIFAVEHRGQAYYPALQFDPRSGQPREILRELIETLSPLYQGWALALWFDGANAWLDGRRPLTLLDTEPARVLAAARAERRLLDD